MRSRSWNRLAAGAATGLAAAFVLAPVAVASSPEVVWKGAVAKTLGAKRLHVIDSFCDHNFCQLDRYDIDSSGGQYWDMQRTWVQQGFGDAGLYSIVNTVDGKQQSTDTTDDPMCLRGRFSPAAKHDRALERLRALFAPAGRWGKGSKAGGYVARGPNGYEASFAVDSEGAFRALSVIPRSGRPVQRLRFTVPKASPKSLATQYGCSVPA